MSRVFIFLFVVMNMSTVIRPVVPSRNPYYISRERYYELKHYCLQYKGYKHRIALEREKWPILGGFVSTGTSTHQSDKVGEKAENLAFLGHYTEMIEGCCKQAGGDIEKYLFKAVIEGKSYAVLNPPYSKEYFYVRYRAFFYLLDKVR